MTSRRSIFPKARPPGSLSDQEATTLWQITSFRYFGPTVPDAVNRARDEGLLVLPVRWPDRLQALVQWRGDPDKGPPAEAILEAYRVARNQVPRLPAAIALRDAKVGGHA